MTTREEFNEEVYSIRANVGGHGNTKWSLECIIDYANTLEEELKALQQRSCEGCKYLDKDTSNSEGNGEYTKGFCVLLGLSKNDRPFKYCSEFTPKEQ